jgi:hypothetical protein
VASLLAKYLPSAATAPAPAPRNLELYQRALVGARFVLLLGARCRKYSVTTV